ncbi:MAG TPA: hypothetical protein VND87_10995 [Stellaceae bacterium]|nr:hypothetical protein [Stellaceae bacterium]
MTWGGALPWVPTAAATALALAACAAAVMLPERPAARRAGLAAMLLCGVVAVGATVWVGRQEHRMFAAREGTALGSAATEHGRAAAARTHTLARLHAAVERLGTIAQLLPPVGAPPPARSFDSVAAGFAALGAQSDDLDGRVKAFRRAANARTIDDATAAAMVAYLRPLGPHRIVVSCAPHDVEAFDYANRIATILQRAGWDAEGPEPTAIFGTGSAMGISLYVRGNAPPDGAHQLLAAFARFNIPYEARIASSGDIPDNETVELFVGKKP